MSSKRLLALVAIASLLTAGQVFAAASIQVNNAAAMEGSFGLEATADGTATSAFVRDLSPNNETVFRASFLFNANDMDIVFGGQHLIFAAAANSVNGSRSIEVQIRRNPSNEFDVRCIAQETGTDATRKYCGVLPISFNGDHLITLEWEAATVPGTDGLVRLTVDGVSTQRGVRNFTQNIRASNLGLLGASVDAGTTGSHYFDDFQSFRTLAP